MSFHPNWIRMKQGIDFSPALDWNHRLPSSQSKFSEIQNCEVENIFIPLSIRLESSWYCFGQLTWLYSLFLFPAPELPPVWICRSGRQWFPPPYPCWQHAQCSARRGWSPSSAGSQVGWECHPPEFELGSDAKQFASPCPNHTPGYQLPPPQGWWGQCTAPSRPLWVSRTLCRGAPCKGPLSRSWPPRQRSIGPSQLEDRRRVLPAKKTKTKKH